MDAVVDFWGYELRRWFKTISRILKSQGRSLKRRRSKVRFDDPRLKLLLIWMM